MKKLSGITKKLIVFAVISFLTVSFACKKDVKGSTEAKATLSGNNYLKYIGFSNKVGGFNFEPKEKSYSVRLLNEDVETIAVNAFAQDEKAKVSVSPSGNVAIQAGTSVNFTITCTAQNGSAREVKVEVRRAKKGSTSISNNAFLKSVKFSSGTLLQEFRRNKTDGYTVHLSASDASTRILVLPENENARITYAPSANIEVGEGEEKECTVTCTAEDGKTKKNYKFKISRESENEIPSLIEIVIGKGEAFSPAFRSDHLTYSSLLPNAIEKVSVRGIPLNKNAMVQVTPSGEVTLTPNVEQLFTIKVSLPLQPSEFKLYTVKVKRDSIKDTVATLSALTLKGDDGTVFPLSPAFSTGVKEYTTNIYKNFDGVLNLLGTPTSSNASAKVFYNPRNLSAEVGAKVEMQCVVTAQAGNQETYTVVATRANEVNLSKDATLKSLTLKSEKGEPIALSPTFTSNVFAYTARVPFHLKGKIRAQYQANHRKATASANVHPTELLQENNATQTITITVTAEDTSVTQNYVVTVTREEANNDADLKELHLKCDDNSDDVTLVPPFSPNITEYTATVPVTTAKVRSVHLAKIFTSTVEPANPMTPLPYTPHTPENPFLLTITVTAQSGVKKTYTIKISSPPYEDSIKMVTVIESEADVTGSGSEGVFVQGRTVKIAPYKMSKTEIAYVEFLQVLEWGKKNGFGFPPTTQVTAGSVDGGDEKEPATKVKWAEAVLWCNAYSAMKGKQMCYTDIDGNPIKSYSKIDDTIKMDMSKDGYRLPTEIEWEFAARGARPNEPAWSYKWAGVTGDSNDQLQRAEIGQFVWHWDNSKDDGNHKTHIVGKKKPTNHDKDDSYPKIYDLSGNVAEWVWDRKGIITATTPITGNETGKFRILRGGWCFNLTPQGVVAELDRCMVTRRDTSYKINVRANEAGMRIVCKN